MAMSSLYGGATGGYRDATPVLRDAGSPDEPEFDHPLISVNIETGEVIAALWPHSLTERRLRGPETTTKITDHDIQKLVEEHHLHVH